MLLALTGGRIASDVQQARLISRLPARPTKESLEWTKYTHAEWSSLTGLELPIIGLSSQQEVVQAEMLGIYNHYYPFLW